MKKLIFVLTSLLVLQACADEDRLSQGNAPATDDGYNSYILAAVPQLKASVSDDHIRLEWDRQDTLSVYTSDRRFVDFIYDTQVEDDVVRFKGQLTEGETIDRYALFPAGEHILTDDQLYVDLPKEYEYESGRVRPVMMAEITDDKPLAFNHLGGMMLFDVKGVPAGATSFRFTSQHQVTGTFAVENGKISLPQQEKSSSVTFKFPALKMVEDMKFFVPVPVGDHTGFTVSIVEDERNLLTKTSSSTNTLLRADLKQFSFAASDIVYVTVDGAGNMTGESWENAMTLTSALACANDGQVIRMAGGTYIPDTPLEGSADNAAERRTFLVNRNITIQGSYKEGTSKVDTLLTPTIISGQLSSSARAYHSMVVASATDGRVVLKGLTFAGSSPMTVNTDALIESAPTTITADGISVSDYRGGGLYLASDALVSSCTIQDNSALFHAKTSGTAGIGLYIAKGVKANVDNTSFISNSGGACGGAIYVHGTIELKDCLLDSNSSTHSGALHNGGYAIISRCIFKANRATSGFAGALRQQGTNMTVSDCSFISNHATNHGGAVQNNRNSISIINCVFDSNVSESDGGAIANWGGGTATLNSCTFTANKADNGGAITNMINAQTDTKSNITITKCLFKGNSQSADNDAIDGGAILNNGSVATVSGCRFEGFTAVRGGAVANLLSKTLSSQMSLEKGCVFTDNHAKHGGAVANIASQMQIANSDFEANTVTGHGGAVYNAFEEGSATVDIAASTFSANTSEGNGGAVMNLYADKSSDLQAPRMNIQNCSFQSNKVVSKKTYSSQGGAIANQCGILSISGAEFIGNHAAHAGAVYSYDSEQNTSTKISNKTAYTYIYNSVFDSNAVDLTANSSAQGSHLRTHGECRNVVVNSTFTRGDSPTGAIRLRTGATCYVVSSTFTDNESGLWNQSSVLKMYNSVTYGNSKSKTNYYANQADGTDYIQSSLTGSMYLQGRYETAGNYLFDSAGEKMDQNISGTLFGSYKDGVYPVLSEPVLSRGMSNAELSALANTIKADMPDLEVKYFLWDQKGSPRSENEKVMGAYIGDVYLDPNRYGYLNGTELVEGKNLRGLVTDDSGNPVQGVAVSDGYDVAVTDANGVYQFTAHPDARILSISVPAEYEIPFRDNRPDFWVYVDPTDYEVRNDFTLKKRTASADNFTIFSLADTHVKTADHHKRFSTETIPDLQGVVASGAYAPESFAVILGDIMFDSYEQVENVKTTLKASPVPVFPCFGNHDCSSSAGTSEVDLVSKYQQHFGPVDYSFNIGKAHIVFMKNMIYEGNKPYGTEGHYYVQGILDHQVEWLRKDLAAVQDKEDKLIIMCVHIPLRGTSNTSKNYREVVRQMLNFKEAHVFSGHHHGVYNHVPSTDLTVGGKAFYDHNQVAAAGSWWASHLNPDGSPNGYMIYNIKGATIADYALKGTAQAADYQMRVYDGGVTYSVPSPFWNYDNWTERYAWSDLGMNLSGKFVVHVFNADVRDWEVNFVQGGVSVPMKRTVDNWYDMASYAFASYYTDWSSGGAERYSTKVANTNFWYIDAPSGNPASEKDWYVEAVHNLNGRKIRYTSSQLHDKFTGFAY